jgi:hypothetical protein
MPMQQALAPEDLSAMRLLPVPDLWPPIDGPLADVPAGRPTTGTALAQQAGDQPGDRSGEQAEGGHAWSRQFAVLLAESLTGARPVRHILPWLSQRGTAHLYRLLPRFNGGQGARIQRIMTAQPSPDVLEMTLIVTVGPRTRALAVRLARAEPTPQLPWRGALPAQTSDARSAASARWLCTDIEAA